MSKPRRELRDMPIAGKIQNSLNKKLIKECERLNISISEYLNRVLKKELIEEKSPH